MSKNTLINLIVSHEANEWGTTLEEQAERRYELSGYSRMHLISVYRSMKLEEVTV